RHHAHPSGLLGGDIHQLIIGLGRGQVQLPRGARALVAGAERGARDFEHIVADPRKVRMPLRLDALAARRRVRPFAPEVDRRVAAREQRQQDGGGLSHRAHLGTPHQGKPTERENSSADTDAVNARGTVPRANGTHVATGDPGPTGSPLVSLARTNVTSGGGTKSRAGWSATATFM